MTIALGTEHVFFIRRRKNRLAAAVSRRFCTRMSSLTAGKVETRSERRTQQAVHALRKPGDHPVSARRPNRPLHGCTIVQPRQVAEPDSLRHPQGKTAEVLESSRDAKAPLLR
ncbi:hypothetical protein ACFQ6O_45050 [Streptomyces sp. NPDC056441]|uniref:hypothetical protein n=1 Tax=Streptomyces sp. NPDC056441 TaxID=3345817 RepID=UPI0036889700